MTELHPSYLIKDGKKQFVVLPYEEFVSLLEELEDALDLIDLDNAIKEDGDAPGIPFDEMRRRLGLSPLPEIAATEMRPVREAQH